MRGRFIVFEGLDGSGKSTQLSLLAQKLTELKRPHIVTREPSDDNRVGLLTREAIRGAFPLENETLALMFAADRYEHVAKVVLPALRLGRHVLCDRYYYSNFAYQGGGAAFARLMQYNAQVMEACRPDLTVFLDVAPEECIRRIQKTRQSAPDIYEDIENQRGARARYMDIFAHLRESENIAVFPADGLSESEAAERIASRVLPLLCE